MHRKASGTDSGKRRQTGYIGAAVTTISLLGTVFFTWRSYNNKRLIDKARAAQKVAKEDLMETQALLGPYEKEFKEYLARKEKMKSEQAEAEDDAFTIAGLG